MAMAARSDDSPHIGDFPVHLVDADSPRGGLGAEPAAHSARESRAQPAESPVASPRSLVEERRAYWANVERIVARLQGFRDARQRALFANPRQRLQRLLELNAELEQSERVLRAAEAGLLVENTDYLGKLLSLESLCQRADGAAGEEGRLVAAVAEIIRGDEVGGNGGQTRGGVDDVDAEDEKRAELGGGGGGGGGGDDDSPLDLEALARARLPRGAAAEEFED
jgi:hypothetical protein